MGMYKKLTQKDIQYEEEETAFRLYTYKNQSLEVSKCMNLAHVTCNKIQS